MKDGWHTLQGYCVFVQNGMIVRGVKSSLRLVSMEDGYIYDLPAYVYRASRYGGYIREFEITPAAFVAGVKRGTIKLL